jgi:AraC-like DNA-binding protein
LRTCESLRLTTAKNEAEEPFYTGPTTSRGALGLAKTAGLEAGSGIKSTFDKQRKQPYRFVIFCLTGNRPTKTKGFFSMCAVSLCPTAHDPVLAVWTHLLSGVLSTLGRMERLANCRRAPARRYYDESLATFLGAEEAHAAIQLVHHLVWNDWVKGAPEAQELDLLLHLSTCGQHGRSGLCPDSFRAFIPDGATEEDGRLFTAQVRGALERLRSRHADQLCRPVANSQHLQLSSRACQIRDLIEREFGDPNLSLKNLGKRFRLSERHLSRLFKSLTGKKVHDYLRDTRMAKAATLLANPDYNIKFIAAATGYKDCSHFCREFRRYIGCTPGEFRRTAGAAAH